MSLRKRKKGPRQESLADRIERLASIVQSANSSERQVCYNEIADWLGRPRDRPLAIGLSGRLGIQNNAPEILKLLQASNDPYECSKYILALGQLEYAPATELIQSKFLHGKTRNAAMVALMLINPASVKYEFKEYAQQNQKHAVVLAGIVLEEYHARHGLKGTKQYLSVIPKEVLRKVPSLFRLPSVLLDSVRNYSRRTWLS
ncbi:MAG: hypothetical protein QXT19_03555 [Candidatus Woesearchaeota archaeon]